MRPRPGLDLHRCAFHRAAVLNLRLCPAYVAGIVLFLLGGVCGPRDAAAAEKDSAPAAAAAPQQNPTPGTNPAGNSPERTPAVGSAGQAGEAPKIDTTPLPTAEPTLNPTAAAATCKNVAAKLGVGDLSVLESLPPDLRTALLLKPTLVNLFICLAIADDNRRYCDALPEERKGECVDQWELVRELKAAPEGTGKTQAIYHLCRKNSPQADCDKVREAMTTADAGKCKGVSKTQERVFCTALATGDATKCNGLPEAADRDFCAALSTDDARRCPKESTDCSDMVRSFAALKKEGLEGAQAIDPRLAAVRKGKQACAPLSADLEHVCLNPGAGGTRSSGHAHSSAKPTP